MFRTAKSITLFTSFALLASSASAQSFSETSAGGSDIPFNASGGVETGNNFGWDVTGVDHTLALNDAAGTAGVTLTNNVSSISSVTVTGLTHTWAGDVQVVLRDPAGVGHNLLVRTGVDGAGVGESADYGGDYTFVQAGTPGSMGRFPDLPSGTDVYASGTYDQTFDGVAGGAFPWPDGDEAIFNTPMTLINGPAGTWTIEIWDWAAGDIGSFSSFTVNGEYGSGGIGTSYCEQNSPNSTGNTGQLLATGSDVVADNSFTLVATQVPSGALCMFTASQTQGFVANPNGSPGNQCLGGNIVRFNRPGEFGVITGGSFSTTLDLNDVPGAGAILAGQTWNFQGWHRDQGSVSHFTNGLEVPFL